MDGGLLSAPPMDAIPGSESNVPQIRTSTGRWRGIVRALRHRNYRLFFAGQIISLCGTFLTQVAMVWLVYSKTGSGRILGLTAFAGQIPAFLLGPFAGVWVGAGGGGGVDGRGGQRRSGRSQGLARCQSLAWAAVVFVAARKQVVVP